MHALKGQKHLAQGNYCLHACCLAKIVQGECNEVYFNCRTVANLMQRYALTMNKCLDTNEKTLDNQKRLSSVDVPRAGVEPARVAPLVFETSASTDSAIWAACFPFRGLKRCKDREFC